MSTQINGDATLVSSHAPIPIASSTNASPIEITTTGAHGLTTGDTVFVDGHATNITANGVWAPITVVSSTKFTLPGSTGTAVGGATGTIQSFGFNSTYAIPSDGDNIDATSVNVAFEAIADRTAWTAAKIGTFWMVDHKLSVNDDDTYATWSNNVGVGGSYATLANASGLLTFYVKPLDILEIDLQANYGTTGVVIVALGYTLAGGSLTKFPGSGHQLAAVGPEDVSFKATFQFTGVFADNSEVLVSIIAQAPGSPTLALQGDYTLSGRLWRDTI